MAIRATRERVTTLLAACVVALLVYAHTAGLRPPAAVPATAPATQFSAVRAAPFIRDVFTARGPHPMGSEENRAVRDAIALQLRALGLPVEVQQAFACSSRYAACGPVENLVGVLHGTLDTHFIAVMAHYDSVAAAPGAGDDGAAVAAVLESARALASAGPPPTGVLFLLTDGEEEGLLGAEAFFSEHPLAARVTAVINLEGSGSEGRSMLLRSGPGSGDLVDAYLAATPAPAGVSATNEIFKWLPNDTDFTVAIARGLPGLDFAFAGERSHYHTPLDRFDNLSLATLQHHGDNLLPLLQRLTRSAPAVGNAETTWYTLYGRHGLTWRLAATPFIASLLLLFAALGARSLLRRGDCAPAALRHALAHAVALFVLLPAIDFALYELLAIARGTLPDWPAFPAPLQAGIAGASLCTVLAFVAVAHRHTNEAAATAAAVLLWSLLGLAVAWSLPWAANTFLIPAGIGACCLVLRRTPIGALRFGREAIALCLLGGSVPFSLGVLVEAEATLGYRMWPLGFPLYALCAVSALPILVAHAARHSVAVPLGLAATFTAACALAFLILPLHSDERPQQVNLLHLQDQDRDAAWWLATSPEPLPEALAAQFHLVDDGAPSLPWLGTALGPRVQAPVLAEPPPEIAVLSAERHAQSRSVRLHLRSPRGAPNLWLLIPAASGLDALEVEGRALDVERMQRSPRWSGTHDLLRLFAMPAQGVTVQVRLRTPDPVAVYVADWSRGLPESARSLRSERDRLAVPAHAGDQTLIFAQAAI